MSPATERPTLALTEACWPVFEFLTHFARQVHYHTVGPPEQVRYEALNALRDAEELARNDPATERLWDARVKPMLVYAIDYKMLNSDWDGRNYWYDNLFETDRTILDHSEALGGEKFFQDCDELQREYELAERRERRDRQELAELLSLYFVCLRLGFRGQYHDRPQELADYVRRLFTRLPAYATTRAKEMFPDAYSRNQEVKVNYNLGMSLTIVLVTFFLILATWFTMSKVLWTRAVGDIRACADRLVEGSSPSDASEPRPAQEEQR
ncbi:MAG: DotU family type IV/VI secretion system protein [Planctomycetes bacterium]|nr:DotU family type IV/VI secretion system protein [Planctomycetota bacterium]